MEHPIWQQHDEVLSPLAGVKRHPYNLSFLMPHEAMRTNGVVINSHVNCNKPHFILGLATTFMQAHLLQCVSTSKFGAILEGVSYLLPHKHGQLLTVTTCASPVVHSVYHQALLLLPLSSFSGTQTWKGRTNWWAYVDTRLCSELILTSGD